MIEGDILKEFKVSNRQEGIRRLLPPISPSTILALGLNYRRHADETKMGYPDSPVLFLKGLNSLIGPGEPILLPKAGPDEVDYEAELTIVIGKPALNVSRADALDYVLGYTCGNDVSARDWQIRKQKGQWARGKSFNTFCPLGPWIVTKDEIADPDNLKIKAVLNDRIMQESSTADMIFSVRDIISDLSRSMMMPAGTVIMTGTPEGVGFTRKPPVFLRPGDTIMISIEKIGDLINPVRNE